MLRYVNTFSTSFLPFCATFVPSLLPFHAPSAPPRGRWVLFPTHPPTKQEKRPFAALPPLSSHPAPLSRHLSVTGFCSPPTRPKNKKSGRWPLSLFLLGSSFVIGCRAFLLYLCTCRWCFLCCRILLHVCPGSLPASAKASSLLHGTC